MPKHLKMAGSIPDEGVNWYNVWARLNPEFADDDTIVLSEIEAEDEELAASANDSCHGFNGHDPHLDILDAEHFGIGWCDEPLYDDWYDESYYEVVRSDAIYARHEDRFAVDEWDMVPLIEHDRRNEECETIQEEDVLETLEASYSHLPHIQSMRMGVRAGLERNSQKPRWTWRRVNGWRYKPSRRPFVLDWFRSA